MDEEGKMHTIKGIYRPISTRQIFAVQLTKYFRKGCQLYAIKFNEIEMEKPKTTMDLFPILNEFSDIFLEEIIGLPPKQDLDFTIDLIPGSTPVSRVPYRMTTPELIGLRMQIQELLDKGYI